jgi:hypothetical protein
MSMVLWKNLTSAYPETQIVCADVSDVMHFLLELLPTETRLLNVPCRHVFIGITQGKCDP